MGRIFVPTRGPEDWRPLLAEPEKHWKDGYSAKTLAHCWEEADGFPRSVASVLENAAAGVFRGMRMLMAFPEYQVALPGGSRPSQNDLFVLARARRGLVSIMVEGKVSEPFGPLVSEWYESPSEGKAERLAFLCSGLGVHRQDVAGVRYQLLHRTASALITAKEFGAFAAVMLVHSFSRSREGFDDYARFAALFGARAEADAVVFARTLDGVELYLGWVTGEERYLSTQANDSGSRVLLS